MAIRAGGKTTHPTAQRTWISQTMTRPSSDAVAAYAASSQNPTDSTDAVCAFSVPSTCVGKVVSGKPPNVLCIAALAFPVTRLLSLAVVSSEPVTALKPDELIAMHVKGA